MTGEKKKRLDETLAAIRHDWGETALRRLGEAEGPGLPPVPSLPTGFPQLDLALGIGGIPKGHLTHLSGAPTSGATTLAYKLLAEAAGEATVYVDVPHTFDADYAARCGVDTDALLLIQPQSVDQALEPLSSLVESATAAILALDHTPGQSRADTAAIHRLLTALHRSRCALVIVERTNTRPLADRAAVRLHLKHEHWLVQRSDVSGYRTRVRILKNQFGRTGQSVALVIGFSTVVAGDGT